MTSHSSFARRLYSAALIVTTAASSILIMSACGSDGTGPSGRPELASITLEIAGDTIVAGDSATASVTGHAADGATVVTPAILWTSSDTTIARVDASGHIRTVGIGSFAIVARTATGSPQLSASKQLYSKRMITSLELSRAAGTDTISIDDTLRIAAVARDGLGNVVPEAMLAWTVSDTAAASIDASGLVHARAMAPVSAVATVVGPAGAFRAGTSDTTALTVRLVFTHIDAGTVHTCGIARGGSVYCWGEGALGRLGDGIAYPIWTAVPHPVRVMSTKTFTNVSTDEQQDSRSGHTCGVATDGSLSCWGSGSWGMLGDGMDGQGIPPHLTAIPVTVGSGHFVDVAIGAKSSCALDVSGAVYCAGDNYFKQLGVDTVTSICEEPGAPEYSASCSNTFIRVSGSTTFSRIFAAGYRTCGLTPSREAYCWGMSLAYFEPPTNSTPTLVPEGIQFATITGGSSHMCGLTPAGIAYCWGTGGFGQLGTGAQAAESVPTRVATLLTFSHIAAGGSHTCAVTMTGDVYCWGSNTDFELGSTTSETCNGNSSYTIVCSTLPVAVSGLPKVMEVAVGQQHSCALTVDGAVYCWGNGERGQLGQGRTSNSVAPVRMKDTR